MLCRLKCKEQRHKTVCFASLAATVIIVSLYLIIFPVPETAKKPLDLNISVSDFWSPSHQWLPFLLFFLINQTLSDSPLLTVLSCPPVQLKNQRPMKILTIL